MRAAGRLQVWGAVLAAAVLAAGGGVLADHGGRGGKETSIQGVVVSLSLTAPAASPGSPSSTAVGTLTLLSPTSGSVTLTVLATTRFQVTGSVLAENFVGAPVQVRTAVQGSAVDALQVNVHSERGGEASEIRGTVSQVGGGTITIDTGPSTSVAAVLDPSLVVTLNDGQAGTLQDVVVGSRVRATWQVQGGKIDITALRVLGGGGSSGNNN